MKTEPTEADKLRNSIQYHLGVMDAGSVQFYEISCKIDELFELSYKEGQSNPKIKQLEWLDDDFPYLGYSVFVDYIISKNISSRYTVTLDIRKGIYINSFKTIEEAKASAQADFEKRVRECLDYD